MKIKNKILPAIAVIGLGVAVSFSMTSEKTPAPVQAVTEPTKAPYTSYIGGSGLVESSTDNISIGTSQSGIVKKVFAKVGERVKPGTPLFQIDDTGLMADLLVKKAGLSKAEAAVSEALASQKDYKAQYELVKGATDSLAVSLDEVQKRHNAVLLADAKVKSAKASVAAAASEIKSIETSIGLLTVRSPITGEVLQVNVRPGEYAQTGALSTPLMRLGNLDTLHVRVDIDENDAWRFKEGSKAKAFMRGNNDYSTDLAFVRVEPYVTPKTSLTGSSTERVDTRVLQVIYSFPRKNLTAYVGQQLDIFIESPETASSPSEAIPATKTGGRA